MKPSLDDTLEERMDFIWGAFRLQIPMFERIKEDLVKQKKGDNHLEINNSAVKNLGRLKQDRGKQCQAQRSQT
jgi:hypothetical protein